jgi:hypothetical protein
MPDIESSTVQETRKGGSMRSISRVLRSPRAATPLGIVAGLAVVGAAYAGIAALTATGVITACKAEATGLVRIVDDASQCRANEVEITWNSEGPPGPPGPPGGLSKLEYVSAGPNSASQQAVEAVCGTDLYVVGGAVRNRTLPGTVRASHPSDGTGTGQRGTRGWFGVVAGGSGPFSVYAICAPAASTESRSSGGQYG